MECIYINLDEQVARKNALESVFLRHRGDDWRLHRLAATPARQLRDAPVPGTLRDAEKACFASHRRAAELATRFPGHVMVLEDDVLFGESSCGSINSILGSLPEDKWDVIFTDVCLGSIEEMIRFLCMRRKLVAAGAVRLIGLQKINFSGATAYIVNQRSKEKLLGLLQAHHPLDIPYDLYLRQLVHQSRIKALVAFPFLTSLSSDADTSQIQVESSAISDVVTNAFRKLLWINRSIEEAIRPVDDIVSRQFIDQELHGAAKLIYALVGNELGVFQSGARDKAAS